MTPVTLPRDSTHSFGIRVAPHWRYGTKAYQAVALEVKVLTNDSAAIFHANKSSQDAAGEHCQGVTRHERWCITNNAMVRYAFDTIVHPDRLTFADALILHALGVSWKAAVCACAAGS